MSSKVELFKWKAIRKFQTEIFPKAKKVIEKKEKQKKLDGKIQSFFEVKKEAFLIGSKLSKKDKINKLKAQIEENKSEKLDKFKEMKLADKKRVYSALKSSLNREWNKSLRLSLMTTIIMTTVVALPILGFGISSIFFLPLGFGITAILGSLGISALILISLAARYQKKREIYREIDKLLKEEYKEKIENEIKEMENLKKAIKEKNIVLLDNQKYDLKKEFEKNKTLSELQSLRENIEKKYYDTKWPNTSFDNDKNKIEMPNELKKESEEKKIGLEEIFNEKEEENSYNNEEENSCNNFEKYNQKLDDFFDNFQYLNKKVEKNKE